MRWVMVIVLCVFLVAGSNAAQQQATEYDDATLTSDAKLEAVARVLDGDTFDLATGERIRLAGINAAEKGKCYADEAGEQLRTLVARGVFLKRTGKDKYGRSVAFVWVDWREVQGSFRLYTNTVNLYLVVNGYAKAYTSEPNPWRASYMKAERWAHSANEGMWNPARCGWDVQFQQPGGFKKKSGVR